MMRTWNDRKMPNEYRQILSAVHMVYRLVNATYNVKELSLRLTRLLCQFINASSSSVYLLDPQKKIQLIALFNNKINILFEKRKALENTPVEAMEVALGGTIIKKRVLGLPMVADDNIGAIFVRRVGKEPSFDRFDREMLSVVVEQSVTAIKNLQLYEQQQKIILGNMKFIGKLMEKRGNRMSSHTPIYFQIVRGLAERLNMSPEAIQRLYYASILHDVGAMDVPITILLKRSQLTPEEFQVIRDHPVKSVALIKPVEFLKPILPIILYHHEKYDGTGYPLGLKKERIPLGARVMAVVDAFEAMIHGRPYKKTLSMDEAIAEIRRNSGTQFDPIVVNAFCELARLKKVRNYLRQIRK